MKRLTPSPLLRRMLVLSSGSVLANLLVLLATPLLTRLYGPEAFGQLAVFISLAALPAVVLCLRYEQAVYLPESTQEAAALVVGAGAVALGGGALAMLVLLLGGPPVWHPDLGQLTVWVPLAALGLALYNLLSNWAVRLHAVREVTVTRLVRAAAQVLTQLALGAGGWPGPGLVAGDLLGRFAGVARLLRRFNLNSRGEAGWPDNATVRAQLRRYRRFPLIAAPTALLNVSVMQAPPLLLAALYSPAVAGFFFMAQRLVGAPMALVGQSVAQVYTAELAARIQQHSPRARPMFTRAVRWLALIGALPLLALALLAPWLLPWLLGGEWTEAGRYVSVLSPFLLGQFIMSPLANTLNVLQLQHWLWWWDLARLGLALPALILPAWVGWPAWQALLAFSVVMGAMYVLLYGMIRVALGRFQQPAA